MRALLAIGVLALVAPLAGGETRLGTGVSLKDAIAIKSLVEQPAAYVGKTLRVDGVATAVCSAMGCWMAVAAEDDEKGATVRIKVDDGAIVFPMTAKGRRVSAEGVFEGVGGNAEAKEAASQTYQLKATGAVIQ
jgi:hypothetical protein